MPNAIKATGVWFEQQSVPEEAFLLAGDGNLIDLRFSVQYRVQDPVAFAYRMAEPEALVRSLTLAALRGIVATSSIDAVYTTERGAIEQRVREQVQTHLDDYAHRLLSVSLLYVHPPQEVHAFAMSRARRRTSSGRSTAPARSRSKRSIRPTAKPRRASRRRWLQGGAHSARRGRRRGLRPQDRRLSRAPELTSFRLQLEALEAVMPGVQKFIRPGADDLKDFDLWLLEPLGGAPK